jgi:lipoprotein-releasing system permease protein
MLVGKIKDLKVGEFGVIIGSILANALNVKVGEPVIFSLTKLNITPMGIFPRYKRFYVKGIYKVGSQVDSGLAIINYEDAQRLFLLGKNVNGIKLKLSDPIAANKITPYLKANIDPSYTIKTWATEMTALFNAIKMEKRFVALLLSIIIVIAGFNIVACLILTVSSKRRDIAILRTLGAQASTIATIFMMKGFIIGLLGVISGSIFGCFLAKNIGEIVSWVESIAGLHIFDPNIFFIVKIPSVLVWADILSICFFSIMLSILASIYPAYQASKILPAEVLRHDRRR